MLLHLKAWGDRYPAPAHHGAPPVEFIHDCGQVFEPRVGCSACGEPVSDGSLSLRPAISSDAGAVAARSPIQNGPFRR